MSRTTIAIHTDTRDRIKTAAEGASKTIDAFLQSLLDEHEQARFWGSFADLTPQSYAAAVCGGGDQLDEGYAIEDQTLGEEA
ncbi:MAG: hypothetical protein LBR32_10570 [Propionibacteriaceae bacterium]|jgi:hypothetical protein|nr:hypothetical protein [Propionibacteriaceae bacterium]